MVEWMKQRVRGVRPVVACNIKPPKKTVRQIKHEEEVESQSKQDIF